MAHNGNDFIELPLDGIIGYWLVISICKALAIINALVFFTMH